MLVGDVAQVGRSLSSSSSRGQGLGGKSMVLLKKSMFVLKKSMSLLKKLVFFAKKNRRGEYPTSRQGLKVKSICVLLCLLKKHFSGGEKSGGNTPPVAKGLSLPRGFEPCQ